MPKGAKREDKGRQREGRAKSLSYLASTLKTVTWKIKHLGASISQRKQKEMPMGAKKRQKGGQREAKGAKKEAKGSAGGAPTGSKSIKRSKLVFGKRFGMLPRCYRQSFSFNLVSFLASFWEPHSMNFRLMCWLRFSIDFWRLLEAFGEAFFMTLEGHLADFFRLCKKRRTPRNHRPCL